MNPKSLSLLLGFLALGLSTEAASKGNRLAYLDETDPFYVRTSFPKLTTPQWVGEPGVKAVVILAIDDMREPAKYELVLRPILNRLKQIDGRAPVTIFCNKLDPAQPQWQSWLAEGLTLEAHTLTHPCPLLANSNLVSAFETYNGCIDLINRIPNNKPVAFRMPCCDSINSPSPRFYAELFNRTNSSGQFLTMDSSVMNIITDDDAALTPNLTTDADGKPKFRKYLPFPSFTTTIENYPYPYIINKLCWEFPAMVPSDWEAQHIHGTNNPVTVNDWKAALDATVIKEGTFTFIFHPHGWIRPDQMVEFIDYAVEKYGKSVKFLNFREAQDRLNQNLLLGQSLRRSDGGDNGARLLDLNDDGFLDVVIANEQMQKTRIWDPARSVWTETGFPAQIVSASKETGIRFGINADEQVLALVRNEKASGAWEFKSGAWQENSSFWKGLDIAGEPILTAQNGHDRGVRLRDTFKSGHSDLIVANEAQNGVFSWNSDSTRWEKRDYVWPASVAFVDSSGNDRGLRLVDINGDGYEDIIFSNEKSYTVSLFVPRLYLGFQRGWSRLVSSGKQGDQGAIPMIVRGGSHPNNGAWFHSGHLWAQNEETSNLPDLVERRSYQELLGGLQPQPKSPQAALAAFQVHRGFKIELVAQEPLVKDPIAYEWGADGKLWVVEMGDYPLGLDGKGKPGGIIRFLEDTDGDGVYDKSTVFLEGVNFPTGVFPWKKGVIVSAAPEIFYAEDTDGDGKADMRKTLFRGFREGNQQHRLNGFDYGLDNWLYGANGESGGEVASASGGPSFNLRGHDFRIRPDAGLIETVAGQTQYGRHRDDWGNWFGNNNPSWLWHYFLPENYLARNPAVAAPSLKRMLADYTDGTHVFAISRSMQRFNDVGMLNHVTSGNSAMPYRDDLFGPEFANSIFISEPVHNIVHREVLEADGISFTSHRAPEEKDQEFVASTDNWFRPTMLKTGPDGALYIADMYRLVLEHPEWIPPDTQKSLNLRAGDDKGRIYRVYPENTTLRKVPRLDRLSTVELVTAMDHQNGWQRDTAQRLLVAARDKSAVSSLEQLVITSSRPKVRLQALCTLDGMEALTPGLIEKALSDSSASVREQAIRLCESNLSREPLLQKDLLKMKDDPSIRVRYQLAFTLGEWPDAKAGAALAEIALKATGSDPIELAVLSSAKSHLAVMIDTLLSNHDQDPAASHLLGKLAAMLSFPKDDDILAKILMRAGKSSEGDYSADQWRTLASVLDALDQAKLTLDQFKDQGSPLLKQSVGLLNPVFVKARAVVLQAVPAEVPTEKTMAAVRLLGRGLTEQEEDVNRLGDLLAIRVSAALQQAALNELKRLRSPEVASTLIEHWKGMAPNQRNEALNILLSRPAWAQSLLASFENQRIPASEIGPIYQQKFLKSNDSAMRERAAAVFKHTASNRQKVVREYSKAEELAGDRSKGALLFRQNCVACHRLKGEGFEVGPDLGSVADKPVAVLLDSILDPNQAFEARYASYSVQTKDGRDLTGVIASETPNNITLRNAGGLSEIILRKDLQAMSSSGRSLMPEGFEITLGVQDLADLIAYIRSK